MNRTTFFSRLIAASFILLSSLAHSTATLTFRDPDGTANSTDTIPVWLTLTTDTDMNFDGSDPNGDSTYGGFVDPADVPTSAFGPQGPVDFDQFTSITMNISFACSGSFTTGGCTRGGEPYEFSFNHADPSLVLLDTFNMNAGESRDFLFGEFTPVDGFADPGTYNFFDASLFIGFNGFGFDSNSDRVNLRAQIDIASTCTTGDTSCDFSRTVVGTAVPLPATIWLFLSALGLLGFRAQRTA